MYSRNVIFICMGAWEGRVVVSVVADCVIHEKIIMWYSALYLV